MILVHYKVACTIVIIFYVHITEVVINFNMLVLY